MIRGRDGQRERGAALVMVLASLAVLAVLAAALAAIARDDGRRARHAIEALRLDAALDGALALALEALLVPQRDPATGAVGRPLDKLSVPFDGGRIWITARFEAEKLDLNSASEASLAAAFAATGISPGQARSLADHVADWRDPDDLPRLSGGEADAYRAAGRVVGPANRPFGDPDDLAQVLGVPAWLVDCLRPDLTVHGGLLERAVPQSVMPPLSGGSRVEIVARFLDETGQLRRAVQWTVQMTGARADPVWMLDRRDRGAIEARAAAACIAKGGR